MTSNNIKINDYAFESIMQLDIKKTVNEHPKAYLEGHINEADTEKILNQLSSEEKLVIKASDASGMEKIIFSGLVEDISVETVNDMSLLKISGIGHSIKLDIKPEIRTFQDSSMSYDNVLSHLECDAGGSNYIVPQYGGTAIGSMLVQYEETNWEFCKRIASRLGTVVIADSTLDSPYLSIGVPSTRINGIINTSAYETVRDLNSFLRLKKNSKNNISESDTAYSIVKDRNFYDMCDSITLNGSNKLVSSVSISFIQGELIGTYILKDKSGFVSKEYSNKRIIGASLSGTVLEVEKDMVRVELFNDVEQSKHQWFVYSTPYSSPDGTGWYFMPEIGDEIRLHFPTQKEKNAYVISSTHITHGARNNPEIKFIRTKRGQSITFYPEAIHIEDGQGSEILLDKKQGIEIKTDKSIKMNAYDNIEISSQSKVIVQGGKSVQIKQSDSIIKVDDTIDISASHVRVQ